MSNEEKSFPRFGPRLRELRLARGLSQKELAGKVEISFTYLSKVETAAAPPPSEIKIRRLAEALGADAEELILLAGKVPSDLKSAVTDSTAVPSLLRALKDGELTEEQLQGIVATLKAQKEKGK